MGILFDLDQTLIDSRPAEPLRRARQWQKVYTMIPGLQPYPGISELLLELKRSGIPVGIVTSAPGSYCSRVIRHLRWPIDATVCYHDTRRHKPAPDPILLGLQRLKVSAEMAVAIGDDPKDIMAAKAARVYAIGVLWGASNHQALVSSRPDLICETVGELREALLDWFL